LDDLPPTVVSAVLADGVRQLGLPALGARRVGRRGRLPVRPPVPGLGPWGLALRDGQAIPPWTLAAGRRGRPSGDRWRRRRRARNRWCCGRRRRRGTARRSRAGTAGTPGR